MKRMKKLLIFIIVVVLFTAFIYLLTYDLEGDGESKAFTEISVIIRTQDGSSFANIKQGIDQAASDMKAEISFITLTEENSVSEQKELIFRELNNGAQAIIISAADSKGLVPVIEKAADIVPIAAIESPVDLEGIPYFSGDNYEMRRAIAKAILRKGGYNKKIAILDSSGSCGNVQERQRGVFSMLEKLKNTADTYPVTGGTDGVYDAIKQADTAGYNILIALDASTLEMAAAALQESGITDIELYGIGSTGRIASYLERGIIKAIVAQNDFNIGYLSVKSVMDTLAGRKEETTGPVEFLVIDSLTMYSTESQRLLFPFVK